MLARRPHAAGGLLHDAGSRASRSLRLRQTGDDVYALVAGRPRRRARHAPAQVRAAREGRASQARDLTAARSSGAAMRRRRRCDDRQCYATPPPAAPRSSSSTRPDARSSRSPPSPGAAISGRCRAVAANQRVAARTVARGGHRRRPAAGHGRRPASISSPQMLNLDLLDAISFTKGCYTGQEIVARTQHLGRIKRRTLRYRVCAAGASPRRHGGICCSTAHQGRRSAVSRGRGRCRHRTAGGRQPRRARTAPLATRKTGAWRSRCRCPTRSSDDQSDAPRLSLRPHVRKQQHVADRRLSS